MSLANSLLILPDDMIYMIVAYLNLIDLVHLGQTSQRLRAICKSVYAKRIVLYINPNFIQPPIENSILYQNGWCIDIQYIYYRNYTENIMKYRKKFNIQFIINCVKLQKFLPYYFEPDDKTLKKVFIRENHKRKLEIDY